SSPSPHTRHPCVVVLRHPPRSHLFPYTTLFRSRPSCRASFPSTATWALRCSLAPRSADGMVPAPFFAEVADAPAGETCVWLDTSDGVRVRAAFWRGGGKGTVLLFPGRTEYVEEYGPAAAAFAARGYAVATIDWRGQGIADRLRDEPAPGHVGRFRDYQRDVAAFVAVLRAEAL